MGLRQMYSNIKTYLAIAQEAADRAALLRDQSKSPKPDGSGFVISMEVTHEAFKQSLIAMAFSGIYFEALLYIVGTMKLGVDEYQKIEKRKTYEQKLGLIGVKDKDLLARCKRFREARNDLIHEKAIEAHGAKSSDFRIAHTEAQEAILFVKDAANILRTPP